MRVNCLHCGHAFGLDVSYSDYEGMLRCPTCGGLLDARIEDGLIRSVRLGMLASPPTQAAEPSREPTARHASNLSNEAEHRGAA